MGLGVLYCTGLLESLPILYKKMYVDKKVIAHLEKCYAMTKITVEGKRCFLAAAEKVGPCYLFSEGPPGWLAGGRELVAPSQSHGMRKRGITVRSVLTPLPEWPTRCTSCEATARTLSSGPTARLTSWPIMYSQNDRLKDAA